MSCKICAGASVQHLCIRVHVMLYIELWAVPCEVQPLSAYTVI